MKKSLFLVFAIFAFIVSCDKDYNTVGSSLINGGNYTLQKEEITDLKAYSRPTGPVQSNNLPVNALGVYTHKVSTNEHSLSHFVTDLQLSTTAPDFGYNRDIQANDSVYIYVPYFSYVSETDSEGNRTFELDSVFGNLDSSIDLKIYQSNYYLRDFDAVNPSIAQKYYSDEKNLVESNLGIQLNNSFNVTENSQFKFSSDEIIIYKTDGDGNYLDASGVVTTVFEERVVKERLEPGIWINLDKTFFLNNVINASTSNLLNNSNFKDHLKGIYFQVTQNSGEQGAMAVLDFSKGYINIQYHSKDEDTSESPLEKKSFKLNLDGNTVNFFENNNFTISDEEESLMLKGGDGSIIYLDLFGPDVNMDGVADKLETLRGGEILINDAILTFTINQSEVEGIEPKRIYVFDATNNSVVLDYTYDTTTYFNPKYNKFQFGGFLQVDETDKGVRYKIRITSHINRIINGNNPDTNKNVVLGISLTDNINVATSVSLKNTVNIPIEATNSTESFNNVPQSSIITPLRTIIYGNHANVDVEDRIKLDIYYTKPD